MHQSVSNVKKSSARRGRTKGGSGQSTMRRRSRTCANLDLEKYMHVALFSFSSSTWLVDHYFEVEQLHFFSRARDVYKWIDEANLRGSLRRCIAPCESGEIRREETSWRSRARADNMCAASYARDLLLHHGSARLSRANAKSFTQVSLANCISTLPSTLNPRPYML